MAHWDGITPMDVERVDFESLVPGEAIVPKALLSLCLGLLLACDRHLPLRAEPTRTFDEDMALAKAQLREHLK